MLTRTMTSASNTLHLPRVIAMCGAKRSGKDLLANYISQKFMYEKIAFADPLKDAVSVLFDFSHDQVGYGGDGESKDIVDKRWGISPRQALQFFGTEVLQYKIQELLPNIDRKFLANSLVSKIKYTNRHFVISDMRFLHEYEEVKKLGALVIRIDRPSTAENQNHDVEVHSSEIEYRSIPYDLYLKNDSDISSLIQKFDSSFGNMYRMT